LGDGDFVEQVLKSAAETLSKKEARKRQGWNLEKIVIGVKRTLGVTH